MRITNPDLWCQYQEQIVETEARFDRGELNIGEVSDQVRLLRDLQMRLEEGGPEIKIIEREL